MCKVSGTTTTLLATGTCTVQATQSGNADYAAAAPVSRSFTVTTGSQTITFAPLSNQAYGSSPPALTATASSGLPVGFNSQTPTVCTVSGTNGTTVTLVVVGTCTIQATQSGNADYAAATPVNQSFMVAQAPQTITFGPLSNLLLNGSSPPALSATATSGLPVAFTSNSPLVCTVFKVYITLLTAGTCSITASQGGNADYVAAPPVTQKFTVFAAEVQPVAALSDHSGAPGAARTSGGDSDVARWTARAASTKSILRVPGNRVC